MAKTGLDFKESLRRHDVLSQDSGTVELSGKAEVSLWESRQEEMHLSSLGRRKAEVLNTVFKS